MKNSQGGFITSLIVAIIALLLLGGGTYVYEHKQASTSETENVNGNDVITTSDYSTPHSSATSSLSTQNNTAVSQALSESDILGATYSISAHIDDQTETSPQNIVFPPHTNKDKALSGFVSIKKDGSVEYNSFVLGYEAFWIYKYVFLNSAHSQAKVYVAGNFGGSGNQDLAYVVAKENGKITTKLSTCNYDAKGNCIVDTEALSTWNTYTDPQTNFSFKYPFGWKVEPIEESYGATDQSVHTAGYAISPTNIKATDINLIIIGGIRISTCGDVPDATHCYGGGKTGKAITYTRSTDPAVADNTNTIFFSEK